MRDQKGLEFVQVMTVPYDAPNVEDCHRRLDTGRRNPGAVYESQEALARTHPGYLVDVGECCAN